MPYLILLFIVSYLDRVNVGYAGLQMTRELGFSNAVFGFGSGIFYLGCFILEIPGGVLAELWSAEMDFAHPADLRPPRVGNGIDPIVAAVLLDTILLGLAEDGFVPALLVYISHWYPSTHRGKAAAQRTNHREQLTSTTAGPN